MHHPPTADLRQYTNPLRERAPSGDGSVLPYGAEPDTFSYFNSFSSDPGAVFLALRAVIWRIRPQFAAAAFACASIMGLAHVYEGYHFTSEVAGSIGLGLLILYGAWPTAAWHPASLIVSIP